MQVERPLSHVSNSNILSSNSYFKMFVKLFLIKYNEIANNLINKVMGENRDEFSSLPTPLITSLYVPSFKFLKK